MSIVNEINAMFDADAGMVCTAYFTVPGEPISKARARFTSKGSRVRSYTPERTLTGEQNVRKAFLASGGVLEPDVEAAFRVEADFYNGTRQRRDIDNMLKLILDGLNGVAWPDDVQVREISGRKHFVPKAEARTEVTVFTLDEGMERPTRPCRQCGKLYRTYASQSARIFCSEVCHLAWRTSRRIRTCVTCGTEWDSGKPASEAKYCSKACRRDAGSATLDCVICGRQFTTFRSWGITNPCCPSDDCRRERDRRTQRERRTTHFPGICLICGTGTTRKEYKRCNPCKLAGKQVPA